MTSRTIQLSFFFIIFGITTLLGFFIFKPYLNTLVLAGTFAIIFYPLHLRLERKFGGKHPSIAAAITVILASLVIFVPASLLGTRVYQEAAALYQRLSDSTAREQAPLPPASENASPFVLQIREKIDSGITTFMSTLNSSIHQSFGWVLSNAGDFSRRIGDIGIRFFIWFLAFYYFLRDGHRLRKIFVTLSPLSDKYDNEIVVRITSSVKSVIGGSLIVAIIQGVAAGVGMWIFGVPSPAIWGAVAVLAALVPTVGTALVILPAAGYLFLLSKTVPMIGLLVWGLLVVGIIDNVLRPKLIERDTKIHPLIVLLSVLGGIALLGPVGFLIGPIVMSLLLEFLAIYNEMILHHKNAAFENNLSS